MQTVVNVDGHEVAEDLVAGLLHLDIDAQVRSNGLVAEVLLNGSIVGLVPYPSQSN